MRPTMAPSSEHVVIVVAPFAGRARSRRGFEDEPPSQQRSSVAASDSANPAIISLDGDRPAAAAVPFAIVIIVVAIVVAIAPVVALTVSRPRPDINTEARPFKVHALSQARRRGSSSHGANEPDRNHRSRNQPHGVSFPVSSITRLNTRAHRSFRWNSERSRTSSVRISGTGLALWNPLFLRAHFERPLLPYPTSTRRPASVILTRATSMVRPPTTTHSAFAVASSSCRGR